MLTIAAETPDQPEIQSLFDQSEAYAAARYPPEDRHMVDADYLDGPHIRFLVARWQGRAVGCGALVLGGDGTAELKRVVVDAETRGKGIGRALMQALETVARDEQVRLIQLETGPASTAAVRLYQACGYRARGPFGAYRDSPHSLFMERELA